VTVYDRKSLDAAGDPEAAIEATSIALVSIMLLQWGQFGDSPRRSYHEIVKTSVIWVTEIP
jgi:hypothetical protein